MKNLLLILLLNSILFACRENDRKTTSNIEQASVLKPKAEIDYKGLMNNIIDEYSNQTVSNLNTIPSIEVELYTIKNNADDIKAALLIKDDTLQSLAKKASEKALTYQKKRFPELRLNYIVLMNTKASESGIMKVNFLNPKKYDGIVFKGIIFNNKDYQLQTLTDLTPMLKEF